MTQQSQQKPLPVSYKDIQDASARLAGTVRRTALIEDDTLNGLLGARVFIKPECLQQTGSFKMRGAYNRLAQLSVNERARGVVAFSSGNHAQGVAKAAALLGIKATIVMPADAPLLKIENTRAMGSHVVLYDRRTEDREAIAADISARTGAVVVPSYNDVHIIAGQGTAGLEVAEDYKQLVASISTEAAPLDMAVFCCGGGGLSSGAFIALREHFPEIELVVVEPDGYDDVKRSLKAGKRLTNEETIDSICDALLTPSPGPLTFEILSKLKAHGVSVSDEEAKAAVKFAANTLKLTVEPGGAAALAALLAGKIETKGKHIAVVLSGGNIDPSLHAKIIAS